MVKTYSNGDNVYSVEMMFAYLNVVANGKHPRVEVPIDDLLHNLSIVGWSRVVDGAEEYYAPAEVIANPGKYPEEITRIKDADLSYPIIVEGDATNIVDGVHRTIKALQAGQKTITVYKFTPELMAKFLISNARDYKAASQPYQLISLFYERFAPPNI